MSFGDRLKAAYGGIKNKEIADKLGVSPSAVQHYLRGRVPDSDTLILIARQTGCDLYWLLTGENAQIVHTEPVEARPIFDEELLREMVREIVREELRTLPTAVQDFGTADEFDVSKAIRETNDPHEIMRDWLASEGREYPEDFGMIFFQGWESFGEQEKIDAIHDARKVLERTLRKSKKDG